MHKLLLALFCCSALSASVAVADRITRTYTAADGHNKITETKDTETGAVTTMSTCVYPCARPGGFSDAVGGVSLGSDEDSAEFKQFLLDRAEQIRAECRGNAEKEAVVLGVYGEGTNSTFLTNHELTATQKRFIALGRNYLAMARYVVELTQRLNDLEKHVKICDGWFSSAGSCATSVSYTKPIPVGDEEWTLVTNAVMSVGRMEARIADLEEKENERQRRIESVRKAAAERKARNTEKLTDDQKVKRAIKKAEEAAKRGARK